MQEAKASLEDADRASQLHPFTALASHLTAGPRIITGGKGVRVTDSQGRQYIDAFAGLYCVNVGYGRDEVARAIYEQARDLAYYHSYAGHANVPSIRLAERILRDAPDGMSKVFFGLSGSDANETNVKIAWHYNNLLGRPQKKKIVTQQRGYHGSTVMAGSLTALPLYHAGFDLPLQGILRTTTPHYYMNAQAGESEEQFSTRLAAELDALICREGADTIAAFIAEPVMGTGGLIPPPAGYFERIQPVLQKHDVLFIADEVVCGFGRTGHPYGSSAFSIRPDFMTLAKGLTSAYLPLSAAVISDRVWQVLLTATGGPFAHGYTYTAHPTCAAAGLANLAIVDREQLAINARDTGAYLLACLKDEFVSQPFVGEVRGYGLLAAVELMAEPTERRRFQKTGSVAARAAARASEEGVIVRAMPHSDALGLAPPLVINRSEVDEVVEKLKRGYRRALDELAREGALV